VGASCIRSGATDPLRQDAFQGIMESFKHVKADGWGFSKSSTAVAMSCRHQGSRDANSTDSQSESFPIVEAIQVVDFL